MPLVLWLQQLLQRFRDRRAPAAEMPVRLQLAIALRKLRPESFLHYSAGLGQALQLEVSWPTMDRYIQALRDAFYVVRDERLIDPTTLPRETFRVSLDRFMTSADGFYLQPQPTVARFKQVATQLCEALEASDEAHYGPAEHNLRMLLPTLQNTLDLARKLHQASVSN